MPAPFTCRLSDDQDDGYCADCGCCYPPEFEHSCDRVAFTRGLLIAVAVMLLVYALIAVAVLGWSW